MKKLLFILITGMIAACQNHQQQEIATDSTAATSEKTGNDHVPQANTVNISGCYMQVLKRDTFMASIQQQVNSITGKLVFDNFEKDGSIGTVTGTLDVDVLKLQYAFASEGMNSVLEIYYKYRNDTLFRGIGVMNNRGDTSFYENPGSIKFDGSALKKVSCETLPVMYR